MNNEQIAVLVGLQHDLVCINDGRGWALLGAKHPIGVTDETVIEMCRAGHLRYLEHPTCLEVVLPGAKVFERDAGHRPVYVSGRYAPIKFEPEDRRCMIPNDPNDIKHCFKCDSTLCDCGGE